MRIVPDAVAHDEDGLTLVELLVVMSILSVVMALITGSAIFLQRTINETDQRFDDLGQARVAMDATTKVLRSAITVDRDETAAVDQNPFRVARRRRLDFVTNLDVTTGSDAPKRVRLRIVNGDELEQRVWDGTIDASGQWDWSGGPTTRIIARGLTTNNLFTFFDEDGNDLTPPNNAKLDEATLDQVRRVGIDVSVQQDPAVDTNPAELSNRVYLPNQFYFDAEDSS